MPSRQPPLNVSSPCSKLRECSVLKEPIHSDCCTSSSVITLIAVKRYKTNNCRRSHIYITQLIMKDGRSWGRSNPQRHVRTELSAGWVLQPLISPVRLSYVFQAALEGAHCPTTETSNGCIATYKSYSDNRKGAGSRIRQRRRRGKRRFN